MINQRENAIQPLQTAGTPIYLVKDVAQIYKGRRVVDIPDLQIHAGEILTLVGPSGAGKSTLLRLLNFLETPSRGTITFKGQEFSAGKEMPLELRRKATMVFQRPILLEGSVYSNVQFGLGLRGQRDDRRLIEETLEEVGMMALSKQRSNTLSGGEAQRVALARAMVIQPDVLLLDEPTANLDPYNVSLIEKIISDLNHKHGTTIVLVTHNVFQARRLADRVVLMLDGKIVEEGYVQQFFEHPTDPRTTAFVKGEMVY